MKTAYGMIAACKYCGQDIQFFGFTKWLDRGANRSCVPFIKNGEVIKPRTKHAPYRGNNTMTSINTLLRANPRNCARGAPMGDCGFINDDQPMTGLRCERLRMVDGDYGPDGTYWGYSPSHGRMYAIFNGENEKFEPAGGLLKYYSAKNRADAIAQFQAEYPGYKFTRGAL